MDRCGVEVVISVTKGDLGYRYVSRVVGLPFLLPLMLARIGAFPTFL